MSPRQILPGECEYGEYEQFDSERGFLTGLFICHHPDHEGCWCTGNDFVCTEWECPEEAAEKEAP